MLENLGNHIGKASFWNFYPELQQDMIHSKQIKDISKF